GYFEPRAGGAEDTRIFSFESLKAETIRQLASGGPVQGEFAGKEGAVIGGGYSSLLVAHDLNGVNPIPPVTPPKAVHWFSDRPIQEESGGRPAITYHPNQPVSCLNLAGDGYAVYGTGAENQGATDRCSNSPDEFPDQNQCSGPCVRV